MSGKCITNIILFFILILVVVSCRRENEYSDKNEFVHDGKKLEFDFSDTLFSAEGTLVPFTPPKWERAIITEEKKGLLNKGKIVSDTLLGFKPFLFKPDSIKEPKTIKVKDSLIGRINPEIIEARSPQSKIINPGNFRFWMKKEGLRSNFVHVVFEDSKGNLWIGYRGGGFSKYDGKYFFHFREKEELKEASVNCFMEDENGTIWIGTSSNGLLKYDGENFHCFTAAQGLPSNFIISILKDSNGYIWIGTIGGGLVRYSNGDFKVYEKEQGLPSLNVISIAEDKERRIWAGTNAGVAIIGEQNTELIRESEGLSGNNVLSLYRDKNGKMLVGTWGKGLNEIENGRIIRSLYQCEVYGIEQAKDGMIWLATGGWGILKLERDSVISYSESDGMSDVIAYNIKQVRTGEFYISTFRGGLNVFRGDRISQHNSLIEEGHTEYLSVIRDKKGRMIYSTFGRNIFIVDGNKVRHILNGKGHHGIIRGLCEDSIGNIYYFSEFGLHVFNGKEIARIGRKSGLQDTSINTMHSAPDGKLLIGTNTGLIIFNGKVFRKFDRKNGLLANEVTEILMDKSGRIILGHFEGLSIINGDTVTRIKRKDKKYMYVMSLLQCGDTMLIGTRDKLLGLNNRIITDISSRDKLVEANYLGLVKDGSGQVWISTNESMMRYQPGKGLIEKYTYQDGFPSQENRDDACVDVSGRIWFPTIDCITIFDPAKESSNNRPPSVQFNRIRLFNQEVKWDKFASGGDIKFENGDIVEDVRTTGVLKWNGLPETLSLPYDGNSISFNFTGISLGNSDKVEYICMVKGLDKKWSAPFYKNEISFNHLPDGKYELLLKARNYKSEWSESISYVFIIRPPWWKTWWFRIFVGLMVIGSVVFYIIWRERKLRADKLILENTVEERTKEVVAEKKIVEAQKHVIEEKHKEITDSINYAERIQRSFLATKQHLNDNLKEYFILFKPKDVVSGDFYWSATLNNGYFAMVCADSTGHGVPGAIMSLLNITSLERACETETSPDKILNATRATIIERLKKDGSLEGGKDGMDCSLISISKDKTRLQVASAHNPVWIIRGEEVIEIKADKMPVGKHDRQNESFTLHEMELQQGDVIYALTDGFPDQFGGEKGKKFMNKNLRELLAKNAQLPMQEQKEILERTFADWVGNLEQVDDVTLVGIRV